MSRNNAPTNRFAPADDEMSAVVRGLYISLLGREPDAPGLAHWVRTWKDGGDLAAIAAGLLDSEEYRTPQAQARRGLAAEAERTRQAAAAAAAILQAAPLAVVDVGAQNLENEDHVYAGLGRHGVPLRVIGFEPLEHRRRERLLTAPRSTTLLPAFVGDGGEHTFHVNEPDSTSSLLPFNRSVTDRLLELAPLLTVRTESAMTTTLDAALRDEPYVDLLKLDIQGFELPALQHARAVLQRTLVVHCEVSFVEIYEGQALFSEVEQFMRSQGFALVDIPVLCRYPLANTPYPAARDWLGWGDAVFFRDRASDAGWREQLVKSLIALVVYRKPSLATSLSRELQGTPGESFHQALVRPAPISLP